MKEKNDFRFGARRGSLATSFLIKNNNMKISQALKQKNKIVKIINTAKSRLLSSNSVIVGATPVYKVREQLSIYTKKTGELNDLKVKISRATQPILPKILEQAELKGLVIQLKYLSVEDGIQSRSYRDTTDVIKVAEIKEQERDIMVEEAEEKIDELQNEIDAFNASTEI